MKKHPALIVGGAVVATALGLATPAMATSHTNGACTWTGTVNYGGGYDTAYEGTTDDCQYVQARIKLRSDAGVYYYITDSAQPSFSKATNNTADAMTNGYSRAKPGNGVVSAYLLD